MEQSYILKILKTHQNNKKKSEFTLVNAIEIFQYFQNVTLQYFKQIL